jgi:hypothetical protein
VHELPRRWRLPTTYCLPCGRDAPALLVFAVAPLGDALTLLPRAARLIGAENLRTALEYVAVRQGFALQSTAATGG